MVAWPELYDDMYEPGVERMGFDGGTGGGPVGVVELIVWLPSPKCENELSSFSIDSVFFFGVNFALLSDYC